MPMLAFLPWLRLQDPIRVGHFHAFPMSSAGDLPEGVSAAVSLASLKAVLAPYRQACHLPLDRIVVVQCDGLPLGADLDERQREAVFRFGQHLAVSGLSDRRFVGGLLDDYTASGHYQVIIQAFTEPVGGGVSLSYRRKGGSVQVFNATTDFQFVLPAHLIQQGRPDINLPLLNALHAAEGLPGDLRERVDASVTQFLLANSDSPDVSLEVESLATYAALERLCDASRKLVDLRAKFLDLLSVVDQLPWVQALRHDLGLPAGTAWPVLEAWLRDFYKLRGNVAHGKPPPVIAGGWLQQEHLVAGAFIYPLALKCLLAQNGLFSLTLEDAAYLVGLEALLGDRPFYAERATPEESELERRARSGWMRQLEKIGEVLLGIYVFDAEAGGAGEAVEAPGQE